MSDLDEKKRLIKLEIEDLFQQVNEMDVIIRNYLADRKNNVYPEHKRLIDKIRNYDIRYLTDPALEGLLDNLQWKLYYHEKSWNQWWEDADSGMQNERRCERHYCAPSHEGLNKKKKYSIDTLWDMQKNKLREHGIEGDLESKEQFKKRIHYNYTKLKKHVKDQQRVVMVFDKKRKQCVLKIEKRSYKQ